MSATQSEAAPQPSPTIESSTASEIKSSAPSSGESNVSQASAVNSPNTKPQPQSERPKPSMERKYDPLKHWDYPSEKDVDLVYLDHNPLITIPRIIGVLALAAVVGFWKQNDQIQVLFHEFIAFVATLPLQVVVLMVAVNLGLLLAIYYFMNKQSIYLVDFACHDAPVSEQVSAEEFGQLMRTCGFFSPELAEFQAKLYNRTGLGDQPSFPAGILHNPPELTMERAREEFVQVFTGALDELFAKTGVKPSEIGILVTNCSLFNPTPSLSAMIINKYKMRTGIQSYNLAGMGCSASVIAVRIASELLSVYPNTYALVFSHENITQNWYLGKETNMLVSNTLFRVGGAAMLLTNKRSQASRSKYVLVDTFRTHLGASEEAYESIYQLEDHEGFRGVRLTKNLLPIVEKGLTLNLTHLGSIVLPLDEQLKYVFSLLKKKLGLSKQLYTPNFKKAIQHFCIHAGGRAIIDGLEKTLELEEKHVAPSRSTLYRFGNTSSSSIWYEFRYIERTGTVEAGDKIWQIALGSGFKCNSAVWRALKTIKNRKASPK